MKHFKILSLMFVLALQPKWICEGYCFLGGDTPTNPFQPVSATGATEQEARDNIDCGPYQETGISCREIDQALASDRTSWAR